MCVWWKQDKVSFTAARLLWKREKFLESYPREPTDLREGKGIKNCGEGGGCLENSQRAKKRDRGCQVMLGYWPLSPICIPNLECIWSRIWVWERSMKESEVEMGLCVNTPSLFPLCFLNRWELTSNVLKILYLKRKPTFSVSQGDFVSLSALQIKWVTQIHPPQMTFWGKTLGKYF